MHQTKLSIAQLVTNKPLNTRTLNNIYPIKNISIFLLFILSIRNLWGQNLDHEERPQGREKRLNKKEKSLSQGIPQIPIKLTFEKNMGQYDAPVALY